jgi:predicted Zn-dependent protease
MLLLAAASVDAQPGSLLDILGQELDRNFRVLKEKGEPAPYFLSFAVTEEESGAVSANLGALTHSGESKGRYLDVSIRVGSPKLDNYHRVRGDRASFTAGTPLVLDDNPSAIRRRLWLDTDRAYRQAAERLIKIRTNSQVKVAEADTSDDFSAEQPSSAVEPEGRFYWDPEQWSIRVRKLSREFAKYPGVLNGSVSAQARFETRHFVSSEGAKLRHGRGFARVAIVASGRAADGMDLVTTESFEAVIHDGLPKDDVIARAVRKAAEELTALLKAPVVDPFVGPAILSGRASGVFFHEIFGHRIEGHRQKDETEGQTFTKSVGQKVLPDFLSVVFDPTKKRAGGIDLNGWYRYDDEGIAARPVQVVESGVLRTFLMSRSPIEGFQQSNGHGRRQPGLEVVSRQSNLLVESAKQVPEAELRKLLVAEIRRQNKPYGLYFQQVTGGFTTTSRAGLQAFKVIPLLVYRVYPDGRPDELVRGADIVGTPLASFAKILATSDRLDVFNGYCGAESGNVPVSAVSPALLVSEIEIEKKQKSQDRPPLLPPPTGQGGSR